MPQQEPHDVRCSASGCVEASSSSSTHHNVYNGCLIQDDSFSIIETADSVAAGADDSVTSLDNFSTSMPHQEQQGVSCGFSSGDSDFSLKAFSTSLAPEMVSKSLENNADIDVHSEGNNFCLAAESQEHMRENSHNDVLLNEGISSAQTPGCIHSLGDAVLSGIEWSVDNSLNSDVSALSAHITQSNIVNQNNCVGHNQPDEVANSFSSIDRVDSPESSATTSLPALDDDDSGLPSLPLLHDVFNSNDVVDGLSETFCPSDPREQSAAAAAAAAAAGADDRPMCAALQSPVDSQQPDGQQRQQAPGPAELPAAHSTHLAVRMPLHQEAQDKHQKLLKNYEALQQRHSALWTDFRDLETITEELMQSYEESINAYNQMKKDHQIQEELRQHEINQYRENVQALKTRLEELCPEIERETSLQMQMKSTVQKLTSESSILETHC